MKWHVLERRNSAWIPLRHTLAPAYGHHVSATVVATARVFPAVFKRADL